MDSLSIDNREIVLISFIVLILIILISSKKIRPSLISLVQAATARQLLIVYSLGTAYLVVSLTFLHHLNFWNNSLLKESLIWLFINGFPLIHGILKPTNASGFYKTAILNNIKGLAFVEFIIGIYTFSLGFEYLLGISATFLILIKLVSERDQSAIRISKLANTLLSILGLILIVNISIQIIEDYNSFFNVLNLKKVLLPLFLTVLFIPFIYCLRLYSKYEETYYVLKRIIKDPELRNYSFYISIVNFNLNTEQLIRWRVRCIRDRPQSKTDVLNSIKDLKRISKIEKSPPSFVSPDIGWSPYLSKDFLLTSGLTTSYYEKHSTDDWFAISDYKVIGSDPVFKNTISYSLSGNELVVKKIELNLTILNVNEEVQALETYSYDIATLYEKSLKQNLKIENISKIKNNIAFSFIVNQYISVSLTTEALDTRADGRQLNFVIEIINK